MPWTNTRNTSTIPSLVGALECESGCPVCSTTRGSASSEWSTNLFHSIFMIYTIGNMVGSLFTGPICDYFGRRAGMSIGSCLIMVGAAVQTAAKNDGYLLAGRFVLGFGVSIGTSAAPTYALELAPPQWRARIVGYYNTCERHCPPQTPLTHFTDRDTFTVFYTGSILATGVAYACNKAQGELAFRLPLALQLLPPVLIAAGCFLIPESPRWLTMWGHRDKAAAILARYHGGGDSNHPIVKLELREFERGIERQASSGVFNFWPLVSTHNARWRFLMMAFMSVFAQLSGNSVLTYYLPSMFTLVGVVSTERRLLLTFMNSIVSCAGAVAGSASNDAVGRRTKLWVGSVVLAGLFAGVTGFSSRFSDGADPGVGISNAGIAFIFLFGCAYSFVYTPLTATYCAEVLSNPMRAKGMGIVSHSSSARQPFKSVPGSSDKKYST